MTVMNNEDPADPSTHHPGCPTPDHCSEHGCHGACLPEEETPGATQHDLLRMQAIEAAARTLTDALRKLHEGCRQPGFQGYENGNGIPCGDDAQKALDQLCALLQIKEPERTTEPTGHNDLWLWFGLSYAGWLTIPRVLMHEMPDDWQKRMAALLNEWDDAWDTSELPSTRVQAVNTNGRITKFPAWLLNYRHPSKKDIEAVRSNTERSGAERPTGALSSPETDTK